ncbi:MAG TPA: hypothetical protein VIU41_03745, partial [Geobacteraceae bacterium]
MGIAGEGATAGAADGTAGDWGLSGAAGLAGLAGRETGRVLLDALTAGIAGSVLSGVVAAAVSGVAFLLLLALL